MTAGASETGTCFRTCQKNLWGREISTKDSLIWAESLTTKQPTLYVCHFINQPWTSAYNFECLDNNDSLAPDFEVNEEFFDQKVKEFVFKYNYTLNPEGVYDAIKYMYTYWPDPHNVTHIREQYINVSFSYNWEN